LTEESAGETDDTSSEQDSNEEFGDGTEEASEGDSDSEEDSEEDDIIQEGRPWDVLGANYLQNLQISTLGHWLKHNDRS